MIKEILLTSLGFSVGVALVSGFYHMRGARKDPARWYYVMARWGYAVAFGLLLEALVKAPLIPPSWRTWVFIIACLVVGVGFTGVAVMDHRRGIPRAE